MILIIIGIALSLFSVGSIYFVGLSDVVGKLPTSSTQILFFLISIIFASLSIGSFVLVILNSKTAKGKIIKTIIAVPFVGLSIWALFLVFAIGIP